MSSVATLIPNWNTSEHIEQWVRSLEAQDGSASRGWSSTMKRTIPSGFWAQAYVIAGSRTTNPAACCSATCSPNPDAGSRVRVSGACMIVPAERFRSVAYWTEDSSCTGRTPTGVIGHVQRVTQSKESA
jgi:hypothetical protein